MIPFLQMAEHAGINVSKETAAAIVTTQKQEEVTEDAAVNSMTQEATTEIPCNVPIPALPSTILTLLPRSHLEPPHLTLLYLFIIQDPLPSTIAKSTSILTHWCGPGRTSVCPWLHHVS